MDTPVALIIFNRPDTTELVFAEIARAKPAKLLVIADGPRKDHPEDREKCAAARAIINRVDWECEVLKNYSGVNLGCGKRPSTGISWVFTHVDRAIILEDDCVPNPTFFRFCDELLERFHDDERVMQINGNNLQFGRKRTSYSYFFSCFNICWGWATWRRAWDYFDIEVKLWPSLRDTSWLQDIVKNPVAIEFWRKIFDESYKREGDIDYWDFQWRFAFWVQNGLAVMPNECLISNIGFTPDATHTKCSTHELANIESTAMTFPLRHPIKIERNEAAERHIIDRLVRGQPKMTVGKSIKQISTIIPRASRKLLSYLLPYRH